MIKTFPFRLDIEKEYNNRMYSVNSNDLKTVKFTFVVTDNGIPLDLTGLTVRIAIRKPDKKAVWQDCTVTNAPKGEVEVILESQAYIKKGEHEAELMLYKGTDTVAITQKFHYRAAEGIMSDKSLKSETVLGPIDEKLNEVQGTIEELRKNGTGIDAQARADIEKTTAALAEKANKNARFANATSKLNIVNYLGNIENIHPKALYFPDKWSGWKYWLAYTPYPGGLTEYENPCIAYSPDGVNWVEPANGTNPLYPVPSAGGYNSDTHLVFNGTELEVWWRTLYDADSSTIYYRRKSADGITWTEPEIMFQSKLYGKDMVSPAILFEDGKYKMWAISNRQIRYNESVNGKDWNSANERICNANWGNITPWHMDIIHTAKGYEAVVQGYITGVGDNNHSELYYIQSTDNLNYSDPILVLQASTSPDAWDNQGIYRSSLVMVDDIYHIYYSGISKNNTRSISLSTGKDILDLKGYASTGTADFRYKAKENGFHLPKVDIKSSGNSYLGTYLRASKTLPYTAQVLGEKRMTDSGGLQIGSLYFDNADKANLEGLPNPIQGQVRSRDTHLEFYNGSSWVPGFQKPRGVKSYTAPATVDLDITDTRLVVFNGTGAITINSITGGTVHEETRLMIDSSGVTVTIPENGQIVNPGRTTVTLNSTNVSCNVMRMASTRWRTFT